jgi:hypothetical protein
MKRNASKRKMVCTQFELLWGHPLVLLHPLTLSLIVMRTERKKARRLQKRDQRLQERDQRLQALSPVEQDELWQRHRLRLSARAAMAEAATARVEAALSQPIPQLAIDLSFASQSSRALTSLAVQVPLTFILSGRMVP